MSVPIPHNTRSLELHDLLHVEDVARFYGIGAAAMRKRIRLEQDCPGWRLRGNRWVVRRSTFLAWWDADEGVATTKEPRHV